MGKNYFFNFMFENEKKNRPKVRKEKPKKTSPLKIGKLIWVKISDLGGVSAVSRGFKLAHIDRHLKDETVEQFVGLSLHEMDNMCNSNYLTEKLENAIIQKGFKRRDDLDKTAPYGFCYGFCFEKIKQ